MFIFVIVLVFKCFCDICGNPPKTKYFDAAEETLIQGNTYQQTSMLVGVLCKCLYVKC